MIERASEVRRFQIAATGAAVVTITTALIACAGPAGASPARPPRGEVICQTLTPGSGDLYVLGSCSDKDQTGGSGNIDLTKLVYGGGTDHHIKIAWASGKVTVFTDSVQESLGACGMQYDEFLGDARFGCEGYDGQDHGTYGYRALRSRAQLDPGERPALMIGLPS